MQVALLFSLLIACTSIIDMKLRSSNSLHCGSWKAGKDVFFQPAKNAEITAFGLSVTDSSLCLLCNTNRTDYIYTIKIQRMPSVIIKIDNTQYDKVYLGYCIDNGKSYCIFIDSSNAIRGIIRIAAYKYFNVSEFFESKVRIEFKCDLVRAR